MSDFYISEVTSHALPRKTPNKVRRRPLCDLKCRKDRNDELYLTIFNVKGKKNNQTSASDADRETLALGSTDNAGNLVNPSFPPYPFTLGLRFFGLHRGPMLDSFLSNRHRRVQKSRVYLS